MIPHESRRYDMLAAVRGEVIDPTLARAEIDEELQLHIDLLTQDLIRQGMSPTTAQQEAIQQFGDKEVFREQCFRIQTRDQTMLQRIHFLLTFALLIAVVWLGTLAGRTRTIGPIEVAQKFVCDVSQPATERLRNLNWLRFYGPPNARNHDVVAAMIELAEETDDPQVRADIFRQLDEVTDPVLKQPLLEALLRDSSPDVRSEAAESLGPYSGAKDVRDALEEARDQDAHPDVQHHATESLLRNASAARVKEMVMSQLSLEEDRLQALRRLRRMDRSNGDPRDYEVIKAMIGLAEATKDARIRADIFRNLDEVNDPVLQTPLLEALANDPSQEVRSEAVETLAHYLNSPEVVEALRLATREDESSEVREEAQTSLSERRR